MRIAKDLETIDKKEFDRGLETRDEEKRDRSLETGDEEERDRGLETRDEEERDRGLETGNKEEFDRGNETRKRVEDLHTMGDLEGIRKKIDSIDSQIRALFQERMELAEQVVQAKAQTGGPIFRPEREAQILSKQTEGMEENLARGYGSLLKRMIALSRQYQYGRRMEQKEASFPFTLEMEGGQAGRKCSEMVLKEGWPEADRKMLEEGCYVNRCRLETVNGREILFITYSKHLLASQNHNRLRLAFVVPDVCGGLANILNIVADYGINLSSLAPIPGCEKGWFSIELETNILKLEAKTLVYQFSQELESFRVLGSYEIV